MKKNNSVANATNENETPVINTEMTAVEKAKAELEKAKQLLKDAKAAEKTEPKEKKLKGTMVTFVNKAGETIKGLGNLYYVVRQDGKLHYKAEDAVTVLEDTAEQITE